VVSWSFLTYHARVLLLVAHDPEARLRDIAASLNITERGAFGILTDLVEAGYVVKGRTAAATATTSRCTSRCQNRTGGNVPSGRSWPW
jgi:predicted transcriptional regulator